MQGSDDTHRHSAIFSMKHGGTGVIRLLLNLIFAPFLKWQKSSLDSHFANWANVGTRELTVWLTSAMVGATTIDAVPSPARQTRILLEGFSTEPFRTSKWWNVVMLPSLTPMKARPLLLARRCAVLLVEGYDLPYAVQLVLQTPTVQIIGDVV